MQLFTPAYWIGSATRGWQWFKDRAHGPYAKAWLALLSFTEASFFLIAPDVLLIAIIMAGASRWAHYALITTAASAAGGVFGYLIGAVFFDTIGIYIVDFYELGDEIVRVGGMFDKNTFWVIFTAAFTPIPYKVFVLAGGFFKVDFVMFLLASILGRGLRFYAIAYLTYRFGEHLVKLTLRYFTLATLLVTLAVIGWVVLHFDLITILGT